LPEVLAAEQRVISSRFNGNRSAYYAALARAGASRSLARGILADELRRAKVAQRMRVPRPSAAAVASFYASYPQMLVRQVKAKPAPAWLSWKARGYALETVAPASVFGLAKGTRTLQTNDGKVKVSAVGSAQPLGSVPLALVAPSIRLALTSFAQGDAFEQRTTTVQTEALATATCLGDDLPAPAPVELETFVPFLSAAG
jgi:hypothetical protein